MSVDVIIEDKRWQAEDLAGLAEVAVAQVYADLGIPDDWEISLMGCNDARIADLNADFRGKPQPTNVLSWPSEERGADLDGGQPKQVRDPELGDIAIAFDTCKREAADVGRTMADHCSHLIVHGTLHLLGYDHERDADATLMEGLEIQILGKLGIADPYKIT
tara:strand:- start:816 stop:1301 length:486 start_codon:yes stop_codon:yes gene_type:complete